jgi:succinate dehydrogenase / fumarate reductase iron-sulfur subunit
MSQIMRLRRVASADHDIKDRNNGYRHEHAFVNNIEKNGLLHEADLLPDSYGGKFHPRAVPELMDSLPVILRALQRGKVTPKKALTHPHKAPKEVKRIFSQIHEKDDRYELNLYVVGFEDEQEEATGPAPVSGGDADAAGSHLPEERSPNQ